MAPRASFLSGPRLLDEAGALPSASPFAHVSINRGEGGLSQIGVISLKNVFFLSLLWCCPSVMGRLLAGRMVLVPRRWLSPPPRSPLLVPRSSIGYPSGGRPIILYGDKSIYLHALDNP
jgi:hypothetical protein